MPRCNTCRKSKCTCIDLIPEVKSVVIPARHAVAEEIIMETEWSSQEVMSASSNCIRCGGELVCKSCRPPMDTEIVRPTEEVSSWEMAMRH